MKVKKDSINLVNKKKNALSTTAQLLNLKKNQLKTTKNDFKNPKKAPFAQQKLNLALSELNVGLEGKPQTKQIYKRDKFKVGLSHSNLKSNKFNKQPKASAIAKGISKNSETTKHQTVMSLSESQFQPSKKSRSTHNRTHEYKSPIPNSFLNKNKGNEQDSQQLDKTEKTRKLSKRKGWNHNSKSKKVKTPKPTSTRLNPVGEERLDLTKVSFFNA